MANDRQELEELRRIDELERKAAGGKTEAKKPSVSKEESGLYDKAKAFGKSAIEAIPGGAGAYGGMELGASLGAMTGPFAPIAVPALGLAGAIGGHYLGEKFGEGAGEMIPEETKKDIGFSKEQREVERKKNPTMSSLGTYAPDIAAVVPGVERAGSHLITKYGEKLSPSKIIESIGTPTSRSDVGEKVSKKITDKLNDFIKTRQPKAKQVFDSYLNEGAAKEGEILADYKNALSEYYAKHARDMSQAEAKFLKDSLERTKGINATIDETLSPIIAQPGIKAIETERRFLGKVLKGSVREGFEAIPTKRKQDVEALLESVIRKHVPKKFDEAKTLYTELSEPINKYGTALGEKVTKRAGEFLPDIPKTDVAKIPDAFFKSRDSIKELKQLAGDDAFVNKVVFEHVANDLRGKKTSVQIRQYIDQNYDWLQEFKQPQGILDKLQKAEQALKNTEKLKTAGKYSAAGVLSAGTVNQIRNLIGKE